MAKYARNVLPVAPDQTVQNQSCRGRDEPHWAKGRLVYPLPGVKAFLLDKRVVYFRKGQSRQLQQQTTERLWGGGRWRTTTRRTFAGPSCTPCFSRSCARGRGPSWPAGNPCLRQTASSWHFTSAWSPPHCLTSVRARDKK